MALLICLACFVISHQFVTGTVYLRESFIDCCYTLEIYQNDNRSFSTSDCDGYRWEGTYLRLDYSYWCDNQPAFHQVAMVRPKRPRKDTSYYLYFQSQNAVGVSPQTRGVWMIGERLCDPRGLFRSDPVIDNSTSPQLNTKWFTWKQVDYAGYWVYLTICQSTCRDDVQPSYDYWERRWSVVHDHGGRLKLSASRDRTHLGLTSTDADEPLTVFTKLSHRFTDQHFSHKQIIVQYSVKFDSISASTQNDNCSAVEMAFYKSNRCIRSSFCDSDVSLSMGPVVCGFGPMYSRYVRFVMHLDNSSSVSIIADMNHIPKRDPHMYTFKMGPDFDVEISVDNFIVGNIDMSVHDATSNVYMENNDLSNANMLQCFSKGGCGGRIRKGPLTARLGNIRYVGLTMSHAKTQATVDDILVTDELLTARKASLLAVGDIDRLTDRHELMQVTRRFARVRSRENQSCSEAADHPSGRDARAGSNNHLVKHGGCNGIPFLLWLLEEKVVTVIFITALLCFVSLYRQSRIMELPGKDEDRANSGLKNGNVDHDKESEEKDKDESGTLPEHQHLAVRRHADNDVGHGDSKKWKQADCGSPPGPPPVQDNQTTFPADDDMDQADSDDEESEREEDDSCLFLSSSKKQKITKLFFNISWVMIFYFRSKQVVVGYDAKANDLPAEREIRTDLEQILVDCADLGAKEAAEAIELLKVEDPEIEYTLAPGSALNHNGISCCVGAYVYIRRKGQHFLSCGHGTIHPDATITSPDENHVIGKCKFSFYETKKSACDVVLIALSDVRTRIRNEVRDSNGDLVAMEPMSTNPTDDSLCRKFETNIDQGVEGRIESREFHYHHKEKDLYFDNCMAVVNAVDSSEAWHEKGESGKLVVLYPGTNKVAGIGHLFSILRVTLGGKRKHISLMTPLRRALKRLQASKYCDLRDIRL